ncbi:MAG: heat-inducible transcriptional repressor HrcA [Rhodobacteraceae bacterium]|nr:heat-inducible transcriptional repressor HrcA [Paracoccaceae bacterium]
MTQTTPLSDLTARSREVFRQVVESYLETGDPVGSKTLTETLTEKVSPATIRNVMSDLEQLGLLDSPHTSAGRIPTQVGLRMFVDGLLEVGTVSGSERSEIERSLDSNEPDIGGMMDKVGSMLSGLTQGASLVLTPKTESPIKHLEFVALSPEKALVVLVTADGQVENRLFTPPIGLTPSAMREAANFLNAILEGHTVSQMQNVVAREIERHRQELDRLSQSLIKDGLAIWVDEQDGRDRLIVRGTSNLVEDDASGLDLERIRQLFDDLERKRDLAHLLDLTEEGDGVRIFIGSENKLFSLSGSSLVVSPYMNAERKIIGAVGVIGPTRLNYGRIVPIVDYTAQLVGRLVSRRS